MLERLKTRPNNAYGKRPEALDQLMHNLVTVEPLLRAAATHEIKTDKPLKDVVDEIRMSGLER